MSENDFFSPEQDQEVAARAAQVPTDAIGTRLISESPINLDLRVGSKMILIGGKQIRIQTYACNTAPQMANFLNNQELIRAASPLVDKAFLDKTISGVRGMFTGTDGFGGKGMKQLIVALMPLIMTPDPTSIFGGSCDPSISKNVVSGALMLRFKTELPNLLPEFIASSWLGGADSAFQDVSKASTAAQTVMPVISID